MRLSDSPEEDAAATAEIRRAELAHSALEDLFDISSDAFACEMRLNGALALRTGECRWGTRRRRFGFSRIDPFRNSAKRELE